MSAVEFVASSSDLWRTRAACRDPRYPRSWWFPEPYHQYQADLAIAVCRKCAVRGECAVAGRSEPEGVWAGVLRGRGRK